MGDLTDLEELEKSIRKREWRWGSVITVAACVSSAFGAGMAAQGFLNKMEKIAEVLSAQIKAVDEKAEKGKQAQECCILARAKVDETSAKLEGHMRPDPKEPRR